MEIKKWLEEVPKIEGLVVGDLRIGTMKRGRFKKPKDEIVGFVLKDQAGTPKYILYFYTSDISVEPYW